MKIIHIYVKLGYLRLDLKSSFISDTQKYFNIKVIEWPNPADAARNKVPSVFSCLFLRSSILESALTLDVQFDSVSVSTF